MEKRLLYYNAMCVVEFEKPSGQCRSVPEKQQHVFRKARHFLIEERDC